MSKRHYNARMNINYMERLTNSLNSKSLVFESNGSPHQDCSARSTYYVYSILLYIYE